MTIIDPTHPLYGRTLPLLRMHSARSKARLVVRLPDGRVQWIPRAVTDLDASAVAVPPPARIAVPTLLPWRSSSALCGRARRICTMTQPMPSPYASSTRPSRSPLPSPVAPPSLWSSLAPSVQQQLAPCLSDLIRRMRGVRAPAEKEYSHELRGGRYFL